MLPSATDATGTTSASFVLQVNDVKDEPPVLPAGSNTFSLTWDEEQAAGSVVFPPFTVTDADAGDTHTFSLAGNCVYAPSLSQARHVHTFTLAGNFIYTVSVSQVTTRTHLHCRK